MNIYSQAFRIRSFTLPAVVRFFGNDAEIDFEPPKIATDEDLSLKNVWWIESLLKRE